VRQPGTPPLNVRAGAVVRVSGKSNSEEAANPEPARSLSKDAAVSGAEACRPPRMSGLPSAFIVPSYPFKPVKVTPSTKCFWAKKKTIRIGISVATEAAIIRCKSPVPSWKSRNMRSPRERVRRLSWRR